MSFLCVAIVVIVGAGTVLGLYYNPKLSFRLGLPFLVGDKDDYILVVDAHNDNGAPPGPGGSQNDDDAIHIMPRDNGSFITIFAPAAGRITAIKYGTIQNHFDNPPNYYVDVSLRVGLGCEVHFSVEGYSDNPSDEELQKELMYITKKQKVEPGDRLFTFASVGSGAHVCYSIFTTKGRYHPFDFMSDEDIAVCHSIGIWKGSGF